MTCDVKVKMHFQGLFVFRSNSIADEEHSVLAREETYTSCAASKAAPILRILSSLVELVDAIVTTVKVYDELSFLREVFLRLEKRTVEAWLLCLSHHHIEEMGLFTEVPTPTLMVK